jgi:hypothetical protein
MKNSNIIHILEKFKKNTDANATNQGFYYQYLVTLNVWLKNYNERNDVAIYCETEDDIKIEDLKNHKVEFTQVKAYAKDFKIDDIEIKKTVENFFHLYIKYRHQNIKPTFTFHTNSNFEGKFFKNISTNVQLTESTKEIFIPEIIKILINKFKEKDKKEIDKLNKSIQADKKFIKDRLNTTNSNSKRAIDKRKNKIQEYNQKIKVKEDEFKKLENLIKDETPNFIDKIKWKAEKKDKESSIDDFIKSIEQEISKIEGFKLDNDSAYAHLINKVLEASKEKNIVDRRLDRKMIDELIKKAEDTDNFKKGLQSAELLLSFHKIWKQHEIQIRASEKIDSKIDDIKNDTEEILDRLPDNKCPPIPSCLSNFQDNSFKYTDNNLKNLTRKIKKEITPSIIFDKFQTKLFYPHIQNEEDTKKELSKKDINSCIWIGWLELLILIYLIENQTPNIEELKINLNNDKEIEVIIKSYFTNEKKYSDFIEELLDNDYDTIKDNSCLIFNSLQPLRPHVYKHTNIIRIIKDIYGESSFSEMNPTSRKSFGIIDFEVIKDRVADAENKGEIIDNIKELIKDVVKKV